MKLPIILTLCVLLPLSFALNSDTTVKNFRIISWNTNGARWNEVADLMKQKFTSGGKQVQADLIALQEAGSLSKIMKDLIPLNQNNQAEEFFDGLPSIVPAARQYQWNDQTSHQTLYLYYIELVETTGSKTPKQNLAIVSRKMVDGVHLLNQQIPGIKLVKNPNTSYLYRPSIGVDIDGAYFFSIHPRPLNTRNEANEIVAGIMYEMTGNFRGRTWLVVGDFNREPTNVQIQAQYQNGHYSAAQTLIATPADKPTRFKPNKRLDYGVIGGPTNFQLGMSITRLRDMINYSHGSDHEPVLFNF